MKINTIGTYILVYLLTCVLFNVLVSAKSTVDQTGYSSQPSETYPVYSQTSTPKTGVDINIKSCKSSRKFDCKKDGQYVTYTPKGNNAFKLVKDDQSELWQASNASDYSPKVEVDLLDNESKAVTIYLPGNKTKLFKKDGSNTLWKEIDTSKLKVDSVNIDYPYETHYYTNIIRGNFRTFIAKTGFVFNGANEYIDDNKFEIWKTDNETEYGNKIEVDLMNNDSKAVTIYFPGNKTKLFMKYNKNDPWTEIDISKIKPMLVDIQYQYDTYFYSNRLDNDVRTFEAKTGFLFNHIKDIDTDIWTTTKNTEYANKVEYAKRFSGYLDLTIHLVNGNKKLFIKEANNPWKEIDITILHPKSVNIDYEHETHSFTNELKNNIRTFTPKTGFTFNCANENINDRKVDIWKTNKESEYSNKIEVDLINNDAKAVTIYFPANNTKLFMKSDKHACWNEIDTKEVNPKQVYIGYPHECFYYKNELDNNVRTFTAKKGFIFNGANEYIYGKKVEVWKTDKESEYSNRIVNEGGNKLTIHLANGSIKVIEKRSDGTWTENIFGSTNETNAVSEPLSSYSEAKTSIPKTGVNLNLKSDTKSTDKFDCKQIGQYVTYTAKGDNAFKLVKEDKTELWQASDASDYSTRVEVDLMNNNSKAVTVYLDDMTKVFKKDGINKLWKEIYTTNVNPKSVSIDYEHESYIFKNKLKGKIRTFTAKPGFAFKGAIEYINDKKVEIWKTNKESEYANKIEVDLMNNDAKAVTLYMCDNKTRIFLKRGKKQPWNEIDTSKVKPEPVNIDYSQDCYSYQNQLKNNIRTFTPKPGFTFNCAIEYINDKKVEIWKTNKESEYANKIEVDLMNNDAKAVTLYMCDNKTRIFLKRGKKQPWNEIDTTRANPKSVNVTDDKETYYYSNKFDNYVRTFTAKNGFLFNNVREDNTHIWNTGNENEYASKVEYTKRSYGNLDITIYLYKKKMLFIKHSDNTWKQIDLTVINTRPINIRYDKETYFCSNKFQNSTRTFEARDMFVFNVVREGTTDIWSTTNQKKYAKKVVTKGDNEVIIYVGDDGNAKVFVKKENGTWIENIAAATLIAQQRVRLLKANPSNPASPLELASNEYTSTTSGNVVSYQIANGVNCTQLFFDDVLLWVYDQNQRGGIYPKSVYHYTNTNVLVLRFAGLDITFSKNDQGGWIFTESGPLAVKFHVVDPNDPNNTVELFSNQFTVSESGDVTTFNIVRGVCPIALTYGPALLWQYDPNQRGGIYPNSLYYIKSKDTLLLRFVGLDIAFAKNTQGLWEYTETDTSGGGAATTMQPLRASSTQSRVRLFKVNPSNPANALELVANEYTSTATGNVVSYQIANGVNCTQLFFDDVLLWVYDQNQRGGIYPKSVYHYTNTNVLVLRFAGLDITFSKNDQGGWIFTESGPLAVKFHVVDPNDPNNTVELFSNQFTVSESGDVTTFNIVRGVCPIALTYGPALLWQYDPNQRGGIYPNSLYYIKSKDTLLLRFVGLDIAFAKNTQGLWEYTETDTSGGGAATTMQPLRASSTQSRVRLFKVNPSNPANALELVANEYTSTATGNVVSYQIANGVNCTQLFFDDVLLWVYDQNQRGGIYPKSVYHYTNTNVLVLRFAGLDITFSKNDQGGWIFTESGPLAVKFHVVDPNDPNNTVELFSNQFTVSESGDVTTFNIVRGVCPIALTYGPALLWQYDPNQRGGIYPNSLYYIKSKDTLLLRFVGLDIAFAKNTQGLWEYTETDTSGGGAATTMQPLRASSTQSRVRLFKVNPSNPANALELVANEYTSTATGNVVSYQIANGVNCTQLFFDDVLLWVYDQNQRGGIYPKSVYHYTNTNVLVLRFAGLDITFAKNTQGLWVYTETATSGG